MTLNFSSIRCVKSWRFAFTVLFAFVLNETTGQALYPNFLVNKPIQCKGGNSFIFTNLTVGNGISYKWDFGDGSFDTSLNSTKVYANTGNYNVTLIATKNNISYYNSKQITVAAEPVIANISIQGTFNGDSYTYISNSTIANGSMRYLWQFGDGLSSTLINPVHTYKDSGFYNASLTAISNYGCVANRTYLLHAILHDTTAIEPQFNTNNTTQCVSNNQFIFTNVTNLANTTSSYWDFGDGSFSYSYNATKTYTQAGTYAVKLVVLKNGITYINEKPIIVGTKVSAGFSPVALSDSGNYIFINSVAVNNVWANNAWSFGDGCSSNDANPAHHFFSGNYIVKLLANNGEGCTDSSTQNININHSSLNNLLDAKFSVNTDSQCVAGNRFLFTNQSLQACNIRYLWSFGDGTTSSNFQPTKSYDQQGNYTITLQVFGGNVSKSISKNVVLYHKAIWTGLHSNNWNDSLNWQCSLPSDTVDVIVKANAANMPSFSNQAISIRNLTIEKNATINVQNSTLKLTGNLVCDVLASTNSTIEFVGIKPQSITGKISVDKLIINNSSGVNIGNSPNDSVNVYDVLTLKLGVLNTSNKLTFKSTATKTARLDKVGVDGNVGNINGTVNIERYFQNKRAWRFFTSPISARGNNTNYSLNNTWQRYTNITGPSGIGLDYYSPYYQVNAWNDATNKWASCKNTYTSFICNNDYTFANTPYFIFLRGDRNAVGTYVSGEFVIRANGYLQTGNQTATFNNKTKGNYLFLGNPYASPVDLALLTSQNITGNFYVYDASLGETGGYVTISNKGNGNWVITPQASQKNNVLQSGQAMLVEVNTGSGFITFSENAKTHISDVNVFRTGSNNLDRIELNLYKVNADGSKNIIDGAVAIFNDAYTNDIDDNDSKKILNDKENIGLMNNGEVLAIESRKYFISLDSLSIYTSGLSDTINYAIEMKLIATDTSLQQIVLTDSFYASNSTSVVNNNTAWYYFSAKTNQVNSSSRFKIYVQNNLLQPAEILAPQLIFNNNNVDVLLKTLRENNVKQLAVYHSINNQSYSLIEKVNPLNNSISNSYSIADKTYWKEGMNYYKVEMLLNNGITTLAVNNINIVLPQLKEAVLVYPNPIKNNFSVEITSLQDDDVVLQINHAATGAIAATINSKLLKGVNKLNFKASNLHLSSGAYVLKIMGDNIKAAPINVIVTDTK